GSRAHGSEGASAPELRRPGRARRDWRGAAASLSRAGHTVSAESEQLAEGVSRQNIPYDQRTGEVIDDAYFEALHERQRRADAAAVVRGQKLWEWAPVIDQLKRDGELRSA